MVDTSVAPPSESIPFTPAQPVAEPPPFLKKPEPEPSLQQAKPAKPKKLLSRYEPFLLVTLILFLTGNALALALPDLLFARWEIGVPLCVMFLGILVYGAQRTETRWTIPLNLWLIALLAGSMHYHYRQFTPATTDVIHQAPLIQSELMGTVVDHVKHNRIVLEVSKLNGQAVTGRVMAYLPQGDSSEKTATPDEASSLSAGTRVAIVGDLQAPFESTVPGTFNQRVYLNSQHITAVLKRPSRIIAFEESNQPYFVLQRITDQLKNRVSQTFTSSLPSPHAEVLGGLVLGDKAIPVDKNTRQAFIATGLIHLLAASGMNVGIIAGAMLWLLSRFKVPYRTRLGVAMAAVAFYSLLTGLPPSIQRAATMLELALFLKLLNREFSPLFLLCIASTLLVGVNPDAMASVGFQFSVLTTFGLIAMVPPLQEKIGYYTTRWLAGLVLVPVIAQLWIWPLSIAYFNQFPLHSVPLNIAALALITPLTLIGFTAGVVSLLFQPLGGLLAWLGIPFLQGLLMLVQWGHSMNWAQWSLASPPGWQILAFYVALFTWVWLLRTSLSLSLVRKAIIALLPLCVMVGVGNLLYAQSESHSRVALLPLSERQEAILIQPANNRSRLLITPAAISYFEARTLADYLKHRHINTLSALVLLPQAEGNPHRGGRSLGVALRNTAIQTVYGPSEFNIPKSVSYQFRRTFPENGGRLTLNTLAMEGALSRFQLRQGNLCLVAYNQLGARALDTDEASRNCGVRLTAEPDGIRVASDSTLLEDRFYELAVIGNRMSVFKTER